MFVRKTPRVKILHEGKSLVHYRVAKLLECRQDTIRRRLLGKAKRGIKSIELKELIELSAPYRDFTFRVRVEELLDKIGPTLDFSKMPKRNATRIPPRKAVVRPPMRPSAIRRHKATTQSEPPKQNLGDSQSMAIPVRFTHDQYASLKRLRQISGTPMQEIVRRAVDAYVQDNPNGVPPVQVS